MLLFIEQVLLKSSMICHFNTSHVTVYQVPFGYIGVLWLFQYISCYCLSAISSGTGQPPLNFNTSHVTVYLTGVPPSTIEKTNFNTSHVTVYLLAAMFMLSPINISIHLMLLFIKEIRTLDSPPRLFQYISCYCLSFPASNSISSFPEFQYISCYCLSREDLRCIT